MTGKRFELMSDDEVIIDNCSIADDGGKQTYWTVEYGQRVKLVELLNELNRLAEANEDRGLAIMTYLHNNYYEIWEEVNNKVFKDD